MDCIGTGERRQDNDEGFSVSPLCLEEIPFVSTHAIDLKGMKAKWQRDPTMIRFAGCSFDAQNDGRVSSKDILPLGTKCHQPTIVHLIRYFEVEMRTISCDSEDWKCLGAEESNLSD